MNMRTIISLIPDTSSINFGPLEAPAGRRLAVVEGALRPAELTLSLISSRAPIRPAKRRSCLPLFHSGLWGLAISHPVRGFVASSYVENP
uniref:Uncharacterized protein n=2 Tax=Oryza TaxID=4527 RepID=A0A0E0N1G3_ORYRU